MTNMFPGSNIIDKMLYLANRVLRNHASIAQSCAALMLCVIDYVMLTWGAKAV